MPGCVHMSQDPDNKQLIYFYFENEAFQAASIQLISNGVIGEVRTSKDTLADTPAGCNLETLPLPSDALIPAPCSQSSSSCLTIKEVFGLRPLCLSASRSLHMCQPLTVTLSLHQLMSAKCTLPQWCTWQGGELYDLLKEWTEQNLLDGKKKRYFKLLSRALCVALFVDR